MYCWSPSTHYQNIISFSGKHYLAITFYVLATQFLLEYEEVFKFRLNNDMAEFAIAAMIYSPFIERFDPRVSWRLIKADPDDDKFSDCAIAANADFLISNDNHFNALNEIPFPKIVVLSADEFLEMITPKAP